MTAMYTIRVRRCFLIVTKEAKVYSRMMDKI